MDLSFSNLSCQPVRIYKHPDLEKDKTRKFSNSVNYVYVTPDLKYLIAGYLSGQIIIFDYNTGKLRYSYKPHSRKVIHLEYYEPERILLSTGADGRICLFELETFEFIQEIVQPDLKGYEHLNEIRFVLVDEYMKYLFFGSNNGCLYQCNKDNRYRIMPQNFACKLDTIHRTFDINIHQNHLILIADQRDHHIISIVMTHHILNLGLSQNISQVSLCNHLILYDNYPAW